MPETVPARRVENSGKNITLPYPESISIHNDIAILNIPRPRYSDLTNIFKRGCKWPQ